MCVETHFYKNPENVLNENDLAEIIVDGCADGGADIILSDPDSETCDLIIGQSKFYNRIKKTMSLTLYTKWYRFIIK